MTKKNQGTFRERAGSDTALAQVQGKIDTVTKLAEANIELAMQRGARLEELGTKAKHLETCAKQFKKQSKIAKNRLRWNYWGLYIGLCILLATVLGAVLPLMGAPALGGLIMGAIMSSAPPLWAVVTVNALAFALIAGLLSGLIYQTTGYAYTQGHPKPRAQSGRLSKSRHSTQASPKKKNNQQQVRFSEHNSTIPFLPASEPVQNIGEKTSSLPAPQGR